MIPDIGPRRWVTRSAYARMRGVPFSSVRDAILAGRITCEGNRIDPEVADREWAENTDTTKPSNTVNRRGRPPKRPAPGTPGGGSSGAVTFNSVRTQHEQLRLELARIDLETKRGNLLPTPEVKAAALAEGIRLRDAILRVPVQLAAALAAATDPRECQKMLEAELRAALEPGR